MTMQHAGIGADFSDQTGLFDPRNFAETVTVIGLGGIGASALPTLVTMGIDNIILYDDDDVERRNLASQLLYKPEDLFKSKAEVCRDYLLAYGARKVGIVQRKFTRDDTVTGVVISGVDTMAARQEIWRAVKRSDAQLYLDGRIGGLQASLFAVEPLDGEWYEKRWLFDDSEAAPLPCTQRAIVFPAVALGAMMASHLVNWTRGDMPPKQVHCHMGDLSIQIVGKRSV